MNNRKPLKNNYVLKLYNRNNGLVEYVIKKQISDGASSLVYEGYYIDNTNRRKPVIIKECYPLKLDISREENGFLKPSKSDENEFITAKEKTKQAFILCNELFDDNKLTNFISNTIDIYEQNNTLYIISTYLYGENVLKRKIASLKECISLVKSFAIVIKKLHDKGYLYLDIKPQNIFSLYETTSLIQLFDFDSLIPMGEDKINYKLSFTKGFSSAELQMGEYRKIGRQTDVYGIGALLYYLLFEHTIGLVRIRKNIDFDYDNFKFKRENYSDKLYFHIIEFFNNTLNLYYLDRYSDMQFVIDKLQLIEQYSDTTKPFIYNTKIIEQKNFIGRVKELEFINNWFNDINSKMLFVNGIGGIGKSSLIRQYLYKNRQMFDNIIYLNYQKDIVQTVVDDLEFKINTIGKDENENISEYYKRKVGIIKKLSVDKKVILVIDNFNGDIDENFKMLLNTDIKFVVITRLKKFSNEYISINLKEIQEKQNLYLLFKKYLERDIQEDEFEYLDKIIDKVSSHTLILQLIARQVKNSYLTLKQVEQLMQSNSFLNIIPEKITFAKDYSIYYDNIKNIINVIFKSSGFNNDKLHILKILSFLKGSYIDINLFCDLLSLKSKDDINELIEQSWIEINKNKIYLHPVIVEIVFDWENTKEICDKSILVITAFDSLIDKENGKIYFKLIQNFLDNTKNITDICLSKQHKRLMYNLVINIDRDNEEFILVSSYKLLSYTDKLCFCEKLKLYEKIVEIYQEKNNYDDVKSVLIEYKDSALKNKDKYYIARYYYLLAGFNDELLNGNYDAVSEEDETYLRQMLKYIDRAIFVIKFFDKRKHKEFLLELLRFKVTVIIRSNPEKNIKINNIIKNMNKIINDNITNNILLRNCYLTYAWYYTYVVEDINKSVELVKIILSFINDNENPLDVIDCVLVPCANILFECGKNKYAEKLLLDGIDICNKHIDILPYTRKLKQLKQYLKDIYA